MPIHTAQADFYNESYKNENYFSYQGWIYSPYISSLIAFCGLKKGAFVLDVGCGQGFFSYLFSKHGMKVYGVDTSDTGIRAAQNMYGSSGITFSVADIQTTTFLQKFDCIFVRSCSLYNTETFSSHSDTTCSLLRLLSGSGTLIFAYNSNFSSKVSPKWRYHSLEDAKRHFSAYQGAQIFFINKIMPFLLGTYSFQPFITRINIYLSQRFEVGGDLLCILRKPGRE